MKISFVPAISTRRSSLSPDLPQQRNQQRTATTPPPPSIHNPLISISSLRSSSFVLCLLLGMLFTVTPFLQRVTAFAPTAVTRSTTLTTARRTIFGSATSIRLAKEGQAEVILVGCGAPNRGMGWYHAVQMLDQKCPSASLDYIVEPWFLGGGADSPAGQDFMSWKAEVEAKNGAKFAKSLEEIPPPAAPRLALISGRTADNPKLLSEAIKKGSKCIYLEKPGAPTVAELESMAKEAKAAGVEVLMGYNKNVAKYVRKTREFAATVPGSHVTFVTNNAYENTPESLGECFERNAEGMLKNMAIHELALLATFYDVSVDNIAEVSADKTFSSMQTLKGPSGKDFTDFDKIKFTIKTKNGNAVTVQADRCGGTDSYAAVSDASGKEVFRYYMPDDDDKGHIEKLKSMYPTAMPYFFTQDPDYITVKERVAKHTVDGKPAEGIATIGIAIEALKVAEYLVPVLQKQLK